MKKLANFSGASRSARIAGRRLRTLRKRAGLSLSKVEELTGIDRSNLARYERGEGETSLRRYEELARLYRVPIGDLFDARSAA